MNQNTDKHPFPDKAALRKDLRARRQNLPSPQRANSDAAICRQLSQLIRSRRIKNLAVFSPFDGEPDIIPFCEEMIEKGCKLALPVISEQQCNIMEFHAWTGNSELEKNRFNIPEPQNSPAIPVSGFDMLLIPLVAYDRCGNRLGMGAGYYDRHLQVLRDLSTTLRVGVAYSFQEVARINPNDRDIPMHMIVNENGCFTATNR